MHFIEDAPTHRDWIWARLTEDWTAKHAEGLITDEGYKSLFDRREEILDAVIAQERG